jgi:hypothetical protein
VKCCNKQQANSPWPFDALDAAPDAVPPGVPRAALVKKWMKPMHGRTREKLANVTIGVSRLLAIVSTVTPVPPPC